MRVLMIEAKKEPYVKEIDGNMESNKELVGGELTFTHSDSGSVWTGMNVKK
ncbi:MAG TPA: hypothetical protein VEF53_21150 [Patescibacteria group bacterium]|nr:hypothetical protein [Patescibacteria group bacterium]